MNVIDAISGRKAIRAFLDTPVSPTTIEAILDTARWAPSGVNSQPWQVCIVRGASKEKITQALIEARNQQQPEHADYQYYPSQWVEPYRQRRLVCGKALYDALGIRREDKTRQIQAWMNNYRFFGAPMGLFFLLDKAMEKGSWLDMGMFIQNVMLAARDAGLETCPQAALADYPDIIRRLLDLPDNLAVVCGMALGYADHSQPVNQYRLERAAVGEFTRWYE